MAIVAYVGIPGSGKSYEVVKSIIIPAVRAGRRVVTNVRGIDSDTIRAYCAEKFSVALEKLGVVVNATDSQVSDPTFFPHEQSHAEEVPTSLVRPGDLVVVDEAYKIWGQGIKIPPTHVVFFREHRHYADQVTGTTCDLVLMTQDIGDLNRVLKVVVEQSFKTHKAKGIGMHNLYTITMWEGYKQNSKTIVKDWTSTYDAEIFPLYKSYSGDQQGKERETDARQNIFADRKLMGKIVVFVAVLIFVSWRIGKAWYAKVHPEIVDAKPVVDGQNHRPSPPPVPAYSQDWRIAGAIVADGRRRVILVSSGKVRIVDPDTFVGEGFAETGTVDGQRVTRFSGQPLQAVVSNAGVKP